MIQCFPCILQPLLLDEHHTIKVRDGVGVLLAHAAKYRSAGKKLQECLVLTHSSTNTGSKAGSDQSCELINLDTITFILVSECHTELQNRFCNTALIVLISVSSWPF